MQACGAAKSGDHPRTRGEKAPPVHTTTHVEGSPPHTRGKGMNKSMTTTVNRITPAHAGKRCSRRTPSRRAKDHPRTRGEKGGKIMKKIPTLGSPPHTRGKALSDPATRFIKGITPAHAGKSFPWCPSCQTSQDHPRTRGEKREGEKNEWKA